jgi:hypothetical protein
VGAIGLAVAVLAVLGAAVLVLRDIAAYDRPAAPAVAPGVPELAEVAPPLTVAPVLGVGRLPVAEPVPVAAAVPVVAEPVRPVVTPPLVVRSAPVQPYDTHDSVLAGLAQTEHDERSPLRRVGALAVLLTLTLLTAALVGAGIYRMVSKLG